MAKNRPGYRTLNFLRNQGYKPQIVERFISGYGIRKDLYNIIDIVFLTSKSIVGIQACGIDFSSHRRKLLEEEKESVIYWLKHNYTELILIGWRKVLLKRGGKMKVYKPRIAIITLKNNQIIFEEVNYLWLRIRNQKK